MFVGVFSNVILVSNRFHEFVAICYSLASTFHTKFSLALGARTSRIFNLRLSARESVRLKIMLPFVLRVLAQVTCASGRR